MDYALAGRLTGATVNLDADGGRIYLTGLVEIPEPATLGMLLAGILVLARRRARRT
ncbi:MAG: PEP-CTERM motif protein [Lentisphaerae bacterium ADurb.BinA184]|nr:MAG: PEP-CTERM motif protein [Lentisphaerae bacterium ADurb.BinA184]